ncbi:MAG: substrate-binding domain-containing protein [Lentisphaeria bacterium]|nr:substrate-binding domain-containing protein [Lentisphaeria bacterium]
MEINYQNLRPDRTSPEPLHMQLKNALVREIRALPPNRQFSLKSERELAQLLNICRPTTHRAYVELEREGLVHRHPDKSLSVCRDARKRLLPPFPTLGLIVPMKFSQFMSRSVHSVRPYLAGIFDRASEMNLSTNIIQLPPEGSDPATVGAFIDQMIAPLTGVIHFGMRGAVMDPVLQRLMHYTGVPQILITAYSALPEVGDVTEDLLPGLQSMIRYLKRRGLTRVGLLNHYEPFDPDRPLGEINYMARKRPYFIARELASAGLVPAPEHVLHHCLKDDRLKDFLAELRDRRQLPEVFICSNDTVAQTVLRTAAGLGIPPGTFEVIGIDGKLVAGGYAGEFPTSQVPFYEIGRTAVDLLMKHFHEGICTENRSIKLPTRFITGLPEDNRGDMQE